jgi:hypothetical protein
LQLTLGRALIEITNTNLAHGKTYKVYFDSDATENRAVATADTTNPRKDRVILRVSVATNPDGSSGNVGTVEVLTGTPAGSPSAPAEPSNAITLAIIDVPDDPQEAHALRPGPLDGGREKSLADLC